MMKIVGKLHGDLSESCTVRLGLTANLKRIAANLDETKMRGGPAFVAVITGTGLAYRRKDGVFVIPLACLKP